MTNLHKDIDKLLLDFFNGQIGLGDNIQFQVALIKGDSDRLIELAGPETTTNYRNSILDAVTSALPNFSDLDPSRFAMMDEQATEGYWMALEDIKHLLTEAKESK